MQETRRRRPYAPRVPIEARREQLLDAAMQIIDRDGYDKVSIDSIAREAGVTRPVVYGAYPGGLGELLGALLDRQQQRAFTALASALPTDLLERDPGAFDEAAVALHRMVCADPPTWRVILEAPGNLPASVRERVEADRARVRLLMEPLTPRGADREVFAHAMVAVLEQLGRLILADPQRYTPDRVAGVVRGLLGGADVRGA